MKKLLIFLSLLTCSSLLTAAISVIDELKVIFLEKAIESIDTFLKSAEVMQVRSNENIDPIERAFYLRHERNMMQSKISRFKAGFSPMFCKEDQEEFDMWLLTRTKNGSIVDFLKKIEQQRHEENKRAKEEAQARFQREQEQQEEQRLAKRVEQAQFKRRVIMGTTCLCTSLGLLWYAKK